MRDVEAERGVDARRQVQGEGGAVPAHALEPQPARGPVVRYPDRAPGGIVERRPVPAVALAVQTAGIEGGIHTVVRRGDAALDLPPDGRWYGGAAGVARGE